MYRRLLRDYLSLTRGERRGMRVLCLLLILIVAFRAFIPVLIRADGVDLSQAEIEFIAFHDSLERLQPLNSHPGDHSTFSVKQEVHVSADPFPFDPNTVSFNKLVSLGFSSRTAGTLINYRNAGGEFRKDSDLLRVYGLDPEVYSRLKDYIRIMPKATWPAAAETGSAGPGSAGPGSVGPGGPEGLGDSLYESGLIKQIPAETSSKLHSFELNRADSVQLLSVYGVGPVFASRIIRYRNALGGFYSSDQLMEVYGLSPSQYNEIIPLINIDTTLLRKIDLNRADAGDLSGHPYLDRYQSNAIISYREQMGLLVHTDELLQNGILPDSVFARIRPYLRTGQQ